MEDGERALGDVLRAFVAIASARRPAAILRAAVELTRRSVGAASALASVTAPAGGGRAGRGGSGGPGRGGPAAPWGQRQRWRRSRLRTARCWPWATAVPSTPLGPSSG